MENEDTKLCLLNHLWLASLSGLLVDILNQLLDGILKGGSGVIDLINDENVLAQKVGVAQGGEVQPLSSGNLGAWDFFWTAWGSFEGFVERKTDGLNWDVWRSGLLKERTKDTSWDISTTADGDQESGLELLEDLRGSSLAHFVHLLVEEHVSQLFKISRRCDKYTIDYQRAQQTLHWLGPSSLW
jgi:hypothetical protein